VKLKSTSRLTMAVQVELSCYDANDLWSCN